MDRLFIFGKYLGNKSNIQEPREVYGVPKPIPWSNQRRSEGS
jgi:hypothetical protein